MIDLLLRESSAFMNDRMDIRRNSILKVPGLILFLIADVGDKE